MGFKKINGYQLLFAGASPGVMSSTNTILSNAQNVGNFDNCCLAIKWTGSPTGTISILESADGVQYDAIVFSPALAQPAGSGSQYTINLALLPAQFIQVKYVNASGSGSLFAYIFSKDMN